MTLTSRCQTRLARAPCGNSVISSIASYPAAVPMDAAGGARRDRTDDLMLAKHALYQLSYGPYRVRSRLSWSHVRRTCSERQEVVGPGRLELPTLRLSGVRSNQLSYGPLGGAHTGAPVLEPDGLAIAPERLSGDGRGGKRNGDGDVPHPFRCL